MLFQLLLQITAILITFIILYLHFDRKKLNFIDEQLFTHVLFFNFAIINIEMLMIVSVYFEDYVSKESMAYISLIYEVLVIVELYFINRFLYVRLKCEFKPWGKYLNLIPISILIAVGIVFPVRLYAKDGRFRWDGISIYVLVALMIVYALISIIRIHNKAFFEKGSLKTVGIYAFFVVAEALLLLFARDILFTGAAFSLIVIYLYCKYDIPELYLDRTSKVFNHETFFIVMEERMRQNNNCALLTFSMREFTVLTEVFGLRAVENLISDIMEYMSEYVGKNIFRLETNLFCMCIDSRHDNYGAEVAAVIQKRFADNWDIGGLDVIVKPTFTYYKSTESFLTPIELEEAITFFAVEGRRREDTPMLFINDELLAERRKFIDMQRVLERAISNDEIEVFYQPVYNLKKGKYTGLEALARLKSEDGEFLSAEEFISYAEAGRKVIKLGDVIFRKVCRFARNFNFDLYGIEYISINLSKLQCLQENLAYQLNLVMSEYNIPPYRIRFEVPRADGAAVAMNNYRELAKYGSGITLDKCGIGFSGRLIKNEARISQIKLDMLLFKEYIKSPELMRPLVDTVKMLHSLGYEVAVSSVETMEEYQVIKALEVEYVQGFCLSGALPVDKVITFIQEWL